MPTRQPREVEDTAEDLFAAWALRGDLFPSEATLLADEEEIAAIQAMVLKNTRTTDLFQPSSSTHLSNEHMVVPSRLTYSLDHKLLQQYPASTLASKTS